MSARHLIKTNVVDIDGSPVMLTPQEAARAKALQAQFRRDELHNALGFEINITTLTAILKSVVTQKFFEIKPADYIPIRVGENAWSTEIVTFREFSLAGDFETGLINTGSNNSRLAEADAGVDSVVNYVNNWAKQIGWSLFDLKYAARWGNWDVVSAKERARKRNWDLGIQKIAFFGLASNPSRTQGLLTLPGIASDTSTITTYLKSMTSTQLTTFVTSLMEKYRQNSQRTAYPDRFVIPESDYNGLATMVQGTLGAYPVSLLSYLLEAFKTITQNPNFKILPCAYCDEVNNSTIPGLNKNRYILYRYDEDTLRMDIPVDYTNTLQNTLNGFHFQAVAYGQLTGPIAYRALEIMYFDWAS